jgi:hypothetical protein
VIARRALIELLKAAGTPMIIPFFISFDNITLFPGEFSISSMLGMASPTCTAAREDAVKALMVLGAVATDRRTAMNIAAR